MGASPFDSMDLDVAYRASAEPQQLDVALTSSGPAEVPLAPWTIGSLVDCINRGLAGGAEFAPSLGHARLEAGPTGEGEPRGDELGPSYAFRLEVAGVSPRFLRVMAEQLAVSGHPNRVTLLSIVGSLPPDGGPSSVRGEALARWLADPGAYPQAWPSPGFPVVTKSVPRGATIRVALAKSATDEVATELEETVSAWQSAVLGYPDAKQRARGVMAPHASFARTRTELYAKVALFDHARGPARDALVNALARFHASVTPVASVEIAMP